jgi:transcription-repair coupling factor (superfamily II helicase)
MANFGKLSLFSYLLDNKELLKLDEDKNVNVSSPEALAILTALSFHETPRKMFFLFPTIYEAEAFNQFLGDYLDEDETYMFPYDEIFRSSTIGVSPEMADERLLAVGSIFSNKPSILVAHASSVSLDIMPKERYLNHLLKIKNGDMFVIKDLVLKLDELGYLAVDRVSKANQFSLRGGILDIYDASYSYPVRIEFFGDEVDDLRFFKVNDELSFEHIKEITIHPGSLRLLDSEQEKLGEKKITDEIEKLGTTATDRLGFDDLSLRAETIKEDARKLFLSDINSRFFPLFENEETSIIDYLKGYDKYLYDPKTTLEELGNIKKKETEYFTKCIKTNSSLKDERVYLTKNISLSSFSEASDKGKGSFIIRENSYKALSYAESDLMLKQYLHEGYKIRIALPEPNLTNYLNYLEDKEIPHTLYPLHSDIMLYEGRITHGFEIPEEKHVYLSAKEIYGVSDQRSRFLSRYKEAKIIRKYEDLQVGDYVVHEVNGVGKYLGVITMDGLEYLKIQYADNALFYLPLNQYRLIRKYASREGYSPALDKLGGSTWSRKKARIRSKISYLADQLLTIYSERKTRPGFAFPSEPELEDDFLKAFPYQHTQSQIDVINDIKRDMEAGVPMDRLLAGDVGFGKTEIAFCAAFKAILAHKQVALLCPTTILSMQHYKVAKERFHDFGVHICVFNRFSPKEEQDKNIKLIKEGKVDLIIGTHRLLSDEIVFKDLGLLIVDEEQKFGVAHKEKIKEKAKNVDCLTLTATPIPRTMQMSLLNVRSLSLLEEAPVNRMPVKTYVAKMDKELIYEVIGKELDRKGQVYYLHNDIKSIYDTADILKKHFPNYNISVCHARMDKDDIEDTMSSFYEGNIDILVCTSIIESGLDIPNVNTIIVENADHLGLSQLYQIKGRVGRSDRLAYAYFFFKDSSKMTDDAKKRLKALKDFTELGSGYKIAMQDLNIRGAGDILGSEQAGFVDSLGYDAYIELLNQVVKEKQVVTTALEDKPITSQFELSFSLDAHIPEEYGNETQRINMYRELSDCKSSDDIKAFGDKLRDVYGPYPEEVANLLVKRQIEIYLNSGLYDNFVEGLGVYTITMSEKFSSKPLIFKTIDEVLRPLAVKFRFKVINHRFEFILTKTKDYLADLLFFTSEMDKAYYC